MTTYVVATTETPNIVCPAWCGHDKAWHLSELHNWDGCVIHRSATFELAPGFTADIASTTTVEGTIEEPVTIHLLTAPDEMSVDDLKIAIERLAQMAEMAAS